MICSFIVAAASAAVLALSATAFAADHGTADEAKAMLMKTVAAIKADKAKTIDLINKGEGGFLDRDLYPFCFNISDGKNVAIGNPNAKQLLGVDVRTKRTSTARRLARNSRTPSEAEGQITEVSYMCKAGSRQKAGAEGELRHQGRRSGLRRRLLQSRYVPINIITFRGGF